MNRKLAFSRGVAHPGPAPPAGEGSARGGRVGPQKHVVFRPLCSRPVKNRGFLAAKHPRKPVRFALSEGGIRWHVKTRHFCAGRAAAAGKMHVFEGKLAKTRAFCGPALKTGNPAQLIFAYLFKFYVFSRSKCDPAPPLPSPLWSRHRGGGAVQTRTRGPSLPDFSIIA